MLLVRLVEQLARRFSHEKRAAVCLWFDGSGEFAALARALSEHVAASPDPPFTVLAYDEAVRHGQLWIKHRIAQADEERRFVVYLPRTEDGELDLLTEYRYAGVTWRLDGRRPTLFRFLRAAGVPLTDDPTEQRRLHQGGAASLLARYSARFAGEPANFWTHGTLTPALARERLLGDVDGRILELAVDPAVGWAKLTAEGLLADLREAVAARYDYSSEAAPDSWLRGLVEQVALAEAHHAFGEPPDFPFEDRLPPPALRAHNRDLLWRWLRDSDSRADWVRWIREVEREIDLSEWVVGRPGMPVAFPHLVAARWRGVREAFEAAAPSVSETSEFFEAHAERIAQEAAQARFAPRQIGSWALLNDLRALFEEAARAERAAGAAADLEELVELYVASSATVDAAHLRVRAAAEREEMPAAETVADRVYADYANAMNGRAFGLHAATGQAGLPGTEPVSDEVERTIWSASGRRAVVIIDAFRYDCAHELARAIGAAVEIAPLQAMLPTVTAVGMTALMPPSLGQVTLGVRRSSLRIMMGGRDMAARTNRIRALKEFGADCRDIEDVGRATTPPTDLGELLVVFGHDDVDHLGEHKSAALIRHLEAEIERTARLVERLHRWGYPEVHVVTDHGFILLHEDRLPEEVRCDQSWCALRRPRYALVPAQADIPLTTFPLPWSDELRVAVPPGLAFFMAEKSYSHGGAALQELVIPHLVSRREPEDAPVATDVEVAARELVQTVVRVVLRAVARPAQLTLAARRPRTLALDVLRAGESVLADGPREVGVDADGGEVKISLFFATSLSFRAGETLTLEVRDVHTGERLSSIELTAARDM